MSSIWMPQLANQVSGVLRYKSLTSCNSRKTARWRPACSCLRRGSMRIDGTNEIYYLAMVEVEGYKKFDWSKKFSRKIFKNWYSRLGSIWQRTDFTNESYTNSVGSKEISKLIFFRRKIFKKLISYVQEDGRIFFLHLRFWWQLWPPTNGLRPTVTEASEAARQSVSVSKNIYSLWCDRIYLTAEQTKSIGKVFVSQQVALR